jgi:hypothetical protein
MMFSIKSKPLGTFILCAIDNLFNIKMTQTLTALGILLIKILHSNHYCGYYISLEDSLQYPNLILGPNSVNILLNFTKVFNISRKS